MYSLIHRAYAASGGEYDPKRFNKQHPAQEMPWFGQELFEQAEAKGPLTDTAYRKARNKARRLAGPEGIDPALRKHKLDALVAPSMSPAWLIDPLNGDHFTGAGYGAAAVARYPSITVPMGESHGLPLGITFMGTAWSEPRLIELAYAFEQATQARRPPRFLQTAQWQTSGVAADSARPLREGAKAPSP